MRLHFCREYCATSQGLLDWFEVDRMYCCSVLQCVAVCCSVLQCAQVCCSVLQCVAAWFEVDLMCVCVCVCMCVCVRVLVCGRSNVLAQLAHSELIRVLSAQYIYSGFATQQRLCYWQPHPESCYTDRQFLHKMICVSSIFMIQK